MSIALKTDDSTIRIFFENNADALVFAGARDEHIRLLSERLQVEIRTRGNEVTFEGEGKKLKEARRVVGKIVNMMRHGQAPDTESLSYLLDSVSNGREVEMKELFGQEIIHTARGTPVTPRTIGQKRYVDAVRTSDMVFAIGPAGTGKTYLAVAMAVAALKADAVSRVVLVRPAVEAGEKLGFLPGDLQEKVDPYFRPVYDALHDMIGFDRVLKYIDRRIIEVAPLAYMRGRTLNDAFIILDEAQNTTFQQMKMFLTRIGQRSRAVITGDITQIDLPPGEMSGLVAAIEILKNIDEIKFVFLDRGDVVRHRLVCKIIDAYEAFEEKNVR